MRRGIDPDPEAAILEIGRQEGAGRALAVGAADVDAGEVAFGMAQDVEQSFGGTQRPLDATGLAGKEKPAGVRVGQPGQSAASAGWRPAMCRSSCAQVPRSSERGTTASTMPCSSRNSDVWNPGGRSCPMV